jgi:hypothetical protein
MSMGPFAGVDDDRLFGSVSDDLSPTRNLPERLRSAIARWHRDP